jgi:ABC-type glutathione transport system ATPase component
VGLRGPVSKPVIYAFQTSSHRIDQCWGWFFRLRTSVRLTKVFLRPAGSNAGTSSCTRAQALFAELGLDAGHLQRYPRKLSGGQQQRAAIARAFAAEPDLLICDEITSALDASIQSQLLEQLQQMQSKRSTAMLIITHDLSVIWKMAPRVVVLKDGEIIEQGDTAQVFMHPQAAYTASLIQAATAAHDLWKF